jgi:hypothetical protein
LLYEHNEVNKQEFKMTEDTATIKQNLCLCAITANGVNNTTASPSYVYDKLLNSLKLSPATKDDFELVWGPAVVRIDNGDGDVRDDYMLYMVQSKKDKHDFRLAIRYTLSTRNSQEDFFLIPDVNMNNYIPVDVDNVCITRGMGMVLDDIRDIRSNSLPGLDKTIVEFIREQLDFGLGDGITLTVCGHSFSGMVAPVLGLYLQSQLNDDNVEVKIHAGGATTVGNKEFADYINRCFGENYTRLVNENDITGYLWDTDEMKKIPDLYLPTYEMDDLFKFIFYSLSYVLELSNWGGRQAGKIVSFTQPLNETYDNYTAQALYQHSTSFFDHYGIRQRKESDPDTGEDVVLSDEDINA